MRAGIKSWDYWNLTFEEISDTIENYNIAEKQRIQEQASFTYALSTLIRVGTASCLDSKIKYPTLDEAFPSLYSETTDNKQQQKQQQDWKIAQANLMAYAKAHNKKKDKIRGDK